MFGKLLGKRSKDTTESEVAPELIEKIAKMNLTEMRTYVRNGLKDFEVCIDGLHLVMKRLIDPINDAGEFYIKQDDMDSKKKKAFDLLLLISQSKRISLKTLDLVTEFTKLYDNIIQDYDYRNKDIYTSRFKKAIEIAMINIQTISEVNKRIDVLH